MNAFSGGGPRLFVGHVVRFFPEYVGIKDKIEAGELGTIGVVRTSRRSPFLMGWNDWYADWRASGGVLVDLLIHDFDFLRWTLGNIERVYARGVQGREYNRLDYALVTLRFEGGAIATWKATGDPRPVQLLDRSSGSRPVLTADSTDQPPWTWSVPGPKPRLSSAGPYERELAHFVRCIATGEESVVKPDDAYEALRISLAATESIVKGKPVTLGGQP